QRLLRVVVCGHAHDILRFDAIFTAVDLVDEFRGGTFWMLYRKRASSFLRLCGLVWRRLIVHRLVDESFDFGVELLGWRSSDPPAADDALFINQKQRWPRKDFPFACNRLSIRTHVLVRPPGKRVLLETFSVNF